jgi:ABC-2 type transport system permease protein
MIRPQKVKTVAAFEFFATVKRTGYLVATFGMPLFMAAYGLVVALPTYYATRKGKEPAVFGVVDRPGLLGLTADTPAPSVDTPNLDDVRGAIAATGQQAAVEQALASPTFTFRPFDDDEKARGALVSRVLKGYFVIPADYVHEGVIEIYTPDTFSLSGAEARNAFAAMMRQRLLSGRVQADLATRVVSPLKTTKRFAVTRSGRVEDGGQAASIVRLAVPVVFTVLFLLCVLMTSGYLLQGTATEKENKVVEVLLASADPDEILAGKLLGLGGAGLLQIAVWMAMFFGLGIGALPLMVAAEIQMPWAALAIALPMFLIAFLFFGSLMLGTGSLGSNMRESQQLAMVWSLTAALPMIMMGALIREPHGVLAKILTWVPFTSGPVVVMRASLEPGGLAWWEAVGPVLVLAAATWLAIRFGARLFRIGLLNAGARPSLKEIWRQARLAD